MSKTDHWAEVVDFVISRPTPEQIIAFEGSEDFQERVRYLRDQNRNDLLNDNECVEKDEIAEIGRFLRQLKIRSLEKLTESQPASDPLSQP